MRPIIASLVRTVFTDLEMPPPQLASARHRPCAESCPHQPEPRRRHPKSRGWPTTGLHSTGVLLVAPASALHIVAGPRHRRHHLEAAGPWRYGPRCLSASSVWRLAFGTVRRRREEEKKVRKNAKNLRYEIWIKFEVELCNDVYKCSYECQFELCHGWMVRNVM
jgi:hypothetical protein